MPTMAAPRGFCPTARADLPSRVRVRNSLSPTAMMMAAAAYTKSKMPKLTSPTVAEADT